jgi:hypothetical protein
MQGLSGDPCSAASFPSESRRIQITAAFPESQTGQLRITLFEACSAFTHVTACMLAESLLRPSTPKASVTSEEPEVSQE